MPIPPTVTLVVVTYNSARLLPEFFSALPAALEHVPSHHVVIADNASVDESVAAVQRLAPDATVLQLRANRGYSAAINLALDAVPPSRAAFVLNPDVRLGQGSVNALLGALDQPQTGIAVPRLYERDGTTAPSLRREPSVLRALTAAVIGGRRAGRIGTLGELIYDPAYYAVPGTADWATGAAMMISRACMDATGPWDESFFLYAEEIDYALRARDAGFVLRYVPEATAVHLGGESSVDPYLRALSTVNMLRLYGRRHGPGRTLAFRGALALNEAIRSMTGSRAHRAALRGLLKPSSVRRAAPP
jgi:N-acetylglucosaminyl-diphospho-decaprenol L-rhamnosyltransferase